MRGERRGAVFFALLGAAAVAGWVGGPAAAGCPEGLGTAAEAYRRALAEEQRAVRESTLASPVGIEETVQFDLGNHACHRGPGQAYREFAAPECLVPRPDGRVPVRYRYRLFFRRALTLEELFARPWEEGSDGIVEALFEPDGARWVPVSKREVLDLGGRKGGHPEGGPRP